MTEERKIVREARGAGRWFPGNESALRRMVAGFMQAASVPEIPGRIVSGIAPHAGYQFSGGVAGYTFRALQEQAAAGRAPETVVVLGFSHQAGFPGVAWMDGDAVRTPIGETAIDRDAVQLLCEAGERMRVDYGPHAGEHSAENEIPFVQVALPDAELVVGLIGDHDAGTLDELVAGLDALADRRSIVVIASTDLLHDPDYAKVTQTDKETLALMDKMDHRALLDRWSYGRQICCGIGPVVAAMRFAARQGEADGTVLRYRNSGDDYPESRGNWVVGYGAAVFSVSD